MRFVFRVDASNEIGTGHLMRCLVLADSLRVQNAETHFVCRHITDTLANLLRERQHQLTVLISPSRDGEAAGDLRHSIWLGTTQAQDAADTKAAIGGTGCDWLVLDHYALDARWESELRACARRILVIDDLADRLHDCDVLLDQNLYADMSTRYAGKVPDTCQLLLGPSYALLRDEFRQARNYAKPRTGPVTCILVFFGGMDAGNYTAVAIDALSQIDLTGIGVDVVIGAQHAKRAEIEAACAAQGFVCHVQTQRMAELMLAADLAIGAGGSASWERCCVGLPTLAVAAAENQKQLTRDAALAGVLHAPQIAFTSAGALARQVQALIESPLLREHISRRGMQKLDARGMFRTLRALRLTAVSVRNATHADARRLFEWRNHPSIRQVSRHSDALDRGQHEVWLAAVLKDVDRPLLIGYFDSRPIGVARFDIDNGEAEVSVYLAPESGAEGLGSDLLLAAENWLVQNRPDVTELVAEVLGGNMPSHKLFSNASYQVSKTMYSKRLFS